MVDETPLDGGLKEARNEKKLMQTFRMPLQLVTFLKTEARFGHRDLTGHVIRWLEGFRNYFGLPGVAIALLEADREHLDIERFEYLLHVLYARSLTLRERGIGFDGADSVGLMDDDAS
jgi:hypothetical protein